MKLTESLEEDTMCAQRFELPRWECLSLVRGESVGRLCIVDHGFPLAIPVNYRLVEDGDDVRFVVRTAPDTLLGRYEGPSSLEVDHIQLNEGWAWSVIVRGHVHRADGIESLPDPQPLVTESRTRWLVVDPIGFTGRRFTVAASQDGYLVDWQVQPG